MSTWDIVVTDNSSSPDPKVARFVVRAAKKGEPVVIYGTGNTERQARQDAYEKMEASDNAQAKKEQAQP
jgi:hypothetical protein